MHVRLLHTLLQAQRSWLYSIKMDLREILCELVSQFAAFENKSNWRVNLNMADETSHSMGTRGVLSGRVSGHYFETAAFSKNFHSNSEQLNRCIL
jgi:hypothetical protein